MILLNMTYGVTVTRTIAVTIYQMYTIGQASARYFPYPI